MRNALCGPVPSGAFPLATEQARLPLAIRAVGTLTAKPLSGVHPLSCKALPGPLCGGMELGGCGTGATMLILLLILQWMMKPFVSDPGVSCFLSIPKQLYEASLLTYALVLLLLCSALVKLTE